MLRNKFVVSIVSGLFLASPLLVAAQSTISSISSGNNQNLIAALNQLIQVLEQEIAQIVAAQGGATANSTSQPSASINQSSLTANTGGNTTATATIAGTGSNVQTITIALKGGNSTNTTVTNGTWSATIAAVTPGTYAVEVIDADSGANNGIVLGTGTLSVVGNSQSAYDVHTLKSYPTVDLGTVGATNVNFASGQPIPLIRFSITANSNGPIGIAAINLNVVSNGVTFSNVATYGFVDPAYGTPVQTSQGNGKLGSAGPLSGSFIQALNNGSVPLEIPAGTTYYFEVIGIPSSATAAASVTATLDGDASYVALSSSGLAASANFVWTPNDNGTTQEPGNDWTNGYGVPGLPASGLAQTVTGSGSSSTTVTNPTVALSTDGSTYAPGATVKVTWSNPGTIQSYDWIGLALPNSSWSNTYSWATGQNQGWLWINGAKNGTGTLIAPSTAGTYQLDYYSSSDGSLPHSTLNTSGATFTVQPAPVSTPTCTITSNVTTATPGQSITLSWTTQNATSAFWLAGNAVGLSGSQTFPVDPNSTNYTWTQALAVQNSQGQQGRCSITVPISGAVVTSPTITVTSSSTSTSPTPEITGTAANIPTVMVEAKGNGQDVSQFAPVNGGSWYTYLTLANGTYAVYVYPYSNGTVGSVLATGVLTVSHQ
jgi:hypothetical protein